MSRSSDDDIETQEEAVQVAKEMVARDARRTELLKFLEDEDMFGLECSQTVELEQMIGLDARDGRRLAYWLSR
jgi:hypothetical protein